MNGKFPAQKASNAENVNNLVTSSWYERPLSVLQVMQWKKYVQSDHFVPTDILMLYDKAFFITGCIPLGRDYNNTANSTSSGIPCQRWDSQSRHSPYNNPEWFIDSSMEEAGSFCRNPGLPTRPALYHMWPWCYIEDSGTRYGFCNVESPLCGKKFQDWKPRIIMMPVLSTMVGLWLWPCKKFRTVGSHAYLTDTPSA